MQVLLNVLLALQVLAAMSLIGLVLIQHGKGADMGASFGSGASGSLFGATGSANFLSRSTAVCAAVFFSCTLALAYYSNVRSHSATSTVLDRASEVAPAASAAVTGAAQIPSESSATAPASASAVPSSSAEAPASAALASDVAAPASAAASAGTASSPSK